MNKQEAKEWNKQCWSQPRETRAERELADSIRAENDKDFPRVNYCGGDHKDG